MAAIVLEPTKSSRRSTRHRDEEMDEDARYRDFLDDSSSILSTPSYDGRRSPVPADRAGNTESNAISTLRSVLPMSRVQELLRGARGSDLQSRQQFSTSTERLIIRSQSESDAPTPASNNSDLERYAILADLPIASAPRLRQLAINSVDASPTSEPVVPRDQVLTPTSELRHPRNPGVRLARRQTPFEPVIEKEDEEYGPTSFTASKTETPDDDGFLQGLPLILLVIGLSLVAFLISIDRTIITTAIPYITEEFSSTEDVGWYGSAYLLTACAFQPVFGRVFTLFDIKWSYLLSMFIFEAGSIISGFAPSSICLIFGRAIAGFGSAGILTGSFVIVATAVPLTVRPIYTAIVGLMFSVGATVGPLVGGVFTELLTWRWCFWINLPAGAVTILVMVVVYHPPPQPRYQRTVMDRFLDLDLIGNAFLLSAAVMFFLALEYTLTGADWGSAKIIGLLVGAGLTAVVFIIWIWFKQDSALIPPAIIKQRTVAASCLMAFFTYGALITHTYFIPIWFQSIKDYSAIQSGVAMIPYFVSNALFSLLSGIFVSVVGYFTPPAILGSAIGTVGCGMLTLFDSKISTGMWIGLEILAAAGSGMAIQQGFTAVQTVLSKDQLAVGTAAVVASQSLGGAMFISVGNSVFQNRLQTLVTEAHVPGLDVKAIVEAGAAGFRDVVTSKQLPIVLGKYNDALHSVFITAVPLAALAFLSSCLLEWKSVKPPPKTTENAEMHTLR